MQDQLGRVETKQKKNTEKILRFFFINDLKAFIGLKYAKKEKALKDFKVKIKWRQHNERGREWGKQPQEENLEKMRLSQKRKAILICLVERERIKA